jgi:hypothetical protein
LPCGKHARNGHSNACAFGNSDRAYLTRTKNARQRNLCGARNCQSSDSACGEYARERGVGTCSYSDRPYLPGRGDARDGRGGANPRKGRNREGGDG